jgi:tripartite-type tricarboxylate transporter receptor subunit TctC
MPKLIGKLAMLLAAMVICTALPARADDYPTKPITLIVPFGAGGITDILAREMAVRLKPILGQTVIVENKPGQGGSLGPRYVAGAAADGYTIGLIGAGNAIGATLYTHLPYDLLKDFEPIRLLTSIVNVLVVNPSTKATTVKELIAMAKANPGKIIFSSSGAGGVYHLDLEMFKSMADVNILHVPFRTEAESRTDVIAGRAVGMFDAYGVVAPNIKAGQLRVLAVTSEKRFSGLPNVPTMAEAGVAGYSGDAFIGLVAPKKTPADIVNKLNAAFAKVIDDPQFTAKLATQGMSVVEKQSPEEFGQFLKSQVAMWAKAIKSAGIQRH